MTPAYTSRPRELSERQQVTWAREADKPCPDCSEPMLVGRLDGTARFHLCHRCDKVDAPGTGKCVSTSTSTSAKSSLGSA
jgi:hypothetical protein